MDIKSAFLSGYIEVYVEQPPGFVDPTHYDYVFKLEKDFYDSKQAPRAKYKRLSNFSLEKGFTKKKLIPHCLLSMLKMISWLFKICWYYFWIY